MPVLPSGRMFDDQVVNKLRKYLMFHTLTAGYLIIHSQACRITGLPLTTLRSSIQTHS